MDQRNDEPFDWTYNRTYIVDQVVANEKNNI